MLMGRAPLGIKRTMAQVPGASVRKPSAKLLQTLDIVPRLQKVRKKSASPSGGNL